MTEPTDRQQTIAGLRELADFLDANPDVPLSTAQTIDYLVDSSLQSDGRVGGAERRAEVDRVASLLGVEPEEGATYRAVRTFHGVRYVAFSSNPGPKPGQCERCRKEPVHRFGSRLIDGWLCTRCLTPDVARAFDVAHELTDGVQS